MVLSQPSQSAAPVIFRLSALSAYSTFGELLAGIRKHYNLTQTEIAEASEAVFLRSKVPALTKRIYGDMERGRRAPYFQELEPLFHALVEVCMFEFSDVEITAYVHLARERMAKKGKRRERVDDAQWETLTETLFRINQSKRSRKIYLVKDEPESEKQPIAENPESRRLKSIEQALHTDTSHLLEREEWVTKMLTYPEANPPRKLVVVQGHVGTGKSHVLALLIQRFVAKASNYYLIPYLFEAGESKTPEDHLEVFLATILSDLTMITSDEVKQRPLDERIDQVLAAFKERNERGQKVILLLDDAQAIFPSATEWHPDWAKFFEALVREQHQVTLYTATRTWPGWEGRRLAYVEETELPELSLAASIAIWQRSGFDDVPEDALIRASHRCGYNPQLLEMAAAQCKKRSFTFTWNKNGSVSSRAQTGTNTQRLENFLVQETLFDPQMDVKARAVLQHSLTSHLSHQAVQMLECLVLSPLGLPFPLLIEEFARAEEAFNELANASVVDLNAAASQRAALVPLIREAQYQTLLTDGRKESIDQRVTDLYAYWLTTLQDFRDDAEKAALIAEMVVRYIRQRQLLRAAELFIGYGWLCVLFGHITRIQRVYDEIAIQDRGKERDVGYEVGKLFLEHRIAVNTGQKIARSERDRMYKSIYNRVDSGIISLQPHSELETLQNLLLLYNRNGQISEASQMFDKTLERLHHSGQMTPEVYASFLYSKARLMSSLSEQAEKERNPTEALRYIKESVQCLRESISNWRQCLNHALPLQEHYIKFKLARTLNDYACDLRTLGNLPEAQKVIEESIELKKASSALPHSLAISLSEYSQILAAQGKIRQAELISEEAVQILERSREHGDASHDAELGMLLVERANVFWQQARLNEAKPLLERAVALIGDKPSRQKDKNTASAQIREIELISNSSRPYQLDRRWFPRFCDLVEYDDLEMLAQAGPLTTEEQAEWNSLSSQRNEDGHARMQELLAQSRKRECLRSLEEQRAPTLHYPCIPLDEVQTRISGLISLRTEIGAQETNAVVRRLYQGAIDEHVTVLRLCEATALQDQETVRQCSMNLYGPPSLHEFKIALQQLCTMLLAARSHIRAGPAALEVLEQLKMWGISPQELVAEELVVSEREATHQQDRKLLATEKRTFPTTIVCQLFQDVFAMYGEENWEVSISPARDQTYVDTNVRKLVLPQKSFSTRKIRQLLAEEIEMHAYRAIAGRHSPFALLGSGLAKHIATDEGLAYHYVRQVNLQVYGEHEEKTWNGTLTTGLAAGVLTPALSFQGLRAFLEKMFFVSELVSSDTSWEDALAAARQSAWRRCCRTFRGVPHLEQADCCSLKDRIYLQGYLDVSRYLEQGDEQRLLVGSIGIQHVEDMAELHILAPNHPHQHLALAADLIDILARYDR